VKSYDAGPTDTPILEQTIGENFEQTVRRDPGAEALVDVASDRRWTYGELKSVLHRSGYGKLTAIWYAKGVAVRVPLWIFLLKEQALKVWPRGLRRKIAKIPFPYLTIAARKA